MEGGVGGWNEGRESIWCEGGGGGQWNSAIQTSTKRDSVKVGGEGEGLANSGVLQKQQQQQAASSKQQAAAKRTKGGKKAESPTIAAKQ